MFYVSEIQEKAPKQFQTLLQEEVYKALEKLQIPFQRVATDPAITMEDCSVIEEKLNVKMVKTLFLCNRKQTEFYLFIIKGDKLFRSKEFGAALRISRVSFAPAQQLEEMLGLKSALLQFSAVCWIRKQGANRIGQGTFDRAMVRMQRRHQNWVYEGEDYGYMPEISSVYQTSFFNSGGMRWDFIKTVL